jgi:hypothetical protein
MTIYTIQVLEWRNALKYNRIFNSIKNLSNNKKSLFAKHLDIIIFGNFSTEFAPGKWKLNTEGKKSF